MPTDDAHVTGISRGVDVIVVNFNTRYLLERMMSELEASAPGVDLHVIVIDNASADGSADFIRSAWPGLDFIANKTNVGFGRANNQALPLLRHQYVALLNTDAFPAPGALSAMIGHMEENNRCGILGAKVLGPDGSLQPSCRYFPTPWNNFLARTGLDRFFPGTRLVDDLDWDHAHTRDCDWVTGCFYLIRREVLNQVGFFDPRFFLYYEEVDHCRRARAAGWIVRYFASTTVIHIGGESAQSLGGMGADRQISALMLESELLYFRKHYGLLGLLVQALLVTIADAWIALKLLLKLRPMRAANGPARHFVATMRLLRRTRLGTRATR